MTELLTASQMRAIEQAAIDSGEVTGLELMERAGQGVVEAIFEEWPELAEAGRGPAPAPPGYLDHREDVRRAVVLCGPGNNGGDGFVVARLLRERGWEVMVFLYGDAEKLPPDARVNYERWLEVGEVVALNVKDSWRLVVEKIVLSREQIVVDALFGMGLSKVIEDPIRSVLTMLDDTLDEHVSYYVAVDIPSGICTDSGRELVKWPRKADLTVTFHQAKIAHELDWGPYACGRVVVKDIGLGPWSFHWKESIDFGRSNLSDIKEIGRINSSLMPAQLTDGVLNPKRAGHKYSHGHALILCGPSGKGGAARLAARGALRIGAGLVSLGVPHAALAENAAQLNAIMLAEIEDGDALARVLEDERINVLCLGPGLGVKRARDLVPVALRSGRACVLDADALSVLGNNDNDVFSQLHTGCVLTPHAGEFQRLFPDIAEKLDAPATIGPAYSKVDATREAAVRAGCVVLFKGADTVIAGPDGRCAINSAHYERAAPWLATAGSGDVLAGFITGLMARGVQPMQAAKIAAWLHVECARSFGPGLIAEDLPEELPKVFRQLNL